MYKPCYVSIDFFITDQFSTKRFRCLKKTNPLILGAIKKSNQYQEYDLAVSGHSLKETKEILKKMCDNHEQITQGRVSQTIVTLSQIQKLGCPLHFQIPFENAIRKMCFEYQNHFIKSDQQPIGL